MKNQFSQNKAHYHGGIQLKQTTQSPIVIDDMSVQRKNMLDEIGSLDGGKEIFSIVSQTSTPM